MDFGWLWLIFIDFSWFSVIFVDFRRFWSSKWAARVDFGRFWEALEVSWGLLGQFGVQKFASRTGFWGRRMEEGVKRDRKTPQEAWKGAQKGFQSCQNEVQRVQNWGVKVLKRMLGRNIRKTSKSATLSSENRDFGRTESRKLTKNRTKSRCRTFVSSIET